MIGCVSICRILALGYNRPASAECDARLVPTAITRSDSSKPCAPYQRQNHQQHSKNGLSDEKDHGLVNSLKAPRQFYRQGVYRTGRIGQHGASPSNQHWPFCLRYQRRYGIHNSRIRKYLSGRWNEIRRRFNGKVKITPLTFL